MDEPCSPASVMFFSVSTTNTSDGAGASTTENQGMSPPQKSGLEVFGGKWKSRIICVLAEKKQLRYSLLRNDMVNITDAALAANLKALLKDGIVNRQQFDEIPPRVEYTLTESGRSVIHILQSICQWAGRYPSEKNENVLPRCKKCDYHR